MSKFSHTHTVYGPHFLLGINETTDYSTEWELIDSMIIGNRDNEFETPNHETFSRLVLQNKGSTYDSDFSIYPLVGRLWFSASPIDAPYDGTRALFHVGSVGGLVEHTFNNFIPTSIEERYLVLNGSNCICEYVSSKRFKDKIEDYKINFRKILKACNLKTFKMKNKTKEKGVGYIAEDLAKTDPNIGIYVTNKKTKKKELQNYQKNFLLFSLIELCKKLLDINLDELAKRFPNNEKEKEEKEKEKEIEIEIEKEKPVKK